MTQHDDPRRTVRVLTRKWPDSPHWEFDAVRLGADGLGHWVGVRRGTWISKPGKGFTAWCDHVVLLPHDGWWIATLYGGDEERPVDVYVDITTPSVWSEDESSVRAVDLDLDVIRGTDGRIWVDDEDEFAEHQVRFGYPEEVIANAIISAEQVLAEVTAGRGPYDGRVRAWLARLSR